VVPCPCPNGGQGSQTCAQDGSSFGACGSCVYDYCTPNMTAACVCPNGHLGTDSCMADGSGYSGCGGCSMTACSAGDMSPCVCDDGTQSMASCLADLTGFGTCNNCPTMASDWNCTDTQVNGQDVCHCTHDSWVSNGTCTNTDCCFLGTIMQNGVTYQDCDCYQAWMADCSAQIATVMSDATYTSVQMVASCPQ
jgi:hypothetical protein